MALKGAALALLGLAGLTAIEILRLPDPKSLVARAPASSVILDREGRPIRYALSSEELLAPRVPLVEVSPHLVAATIAAEDARFRDHHGVDLLAVLRALRQNLAGGRVVSGASTITMQAARLLRPLPRSLYSKFREAILAARLELAFSKDEILELYLNLAPYGGNLIGVEGAARRYFGRAPSDLSLAEAALLAGIPQSPARLRPDRHPERARARRDWILGRMAALGLASEAAVREAKLFPVRVEEHPLPFTAPHFAAWALERVAPGTRARTTLDSSLQGLLEEALRARLRDLAPSGIRDGAGVIVETESGKIRAMVGSNDFQGARAGQVNGAASPRSPGSLLKPFIYALAMERGLITPETILQDAPHRHRDGYDPRNFSRRFLGPVTAREALERSLNVPAVDLLARVGVEAAIERLRAIGLAGIRRGASHHGLSLGLGGVEVTLLEIVEAYASLGRLGAHRPLTFLDDSPPAPAKRVLQERAAREVLDILEGSGWPRSEREAGLKLPRAALKTGTSFGLRDAWAVACTPRWTVGIWLGNFDGESSPALVGSPAAAPVALELLRRLQGEETELWFPDVKEKGPPGLAAPDRSLHQQAQNERIRWREPADGAVLVRHPRPGGDTLPISAEAEPPGPLACFVDGEFLGRCPPGGAIPWPLAPGTHRVTLVAPGGRSETRRIRVE